MGAGFGQKIGKARAPRSLADDIEQIAVQSDSGILPFTPRPRTRCGASQPHEERPAGVILQIANDPIRAFPPPGGKIVTADAFGILRKIPQQIFCVQ